MNMTNLHISMLNLKILFFILKIVDLLYNINTVKSKSMQVSRLHEKVNSNPQVTEKEERRVPNSP